MCTILNSHLDDGVGNILARGKEANKTEYFRGFTLWMRFKYFLGSRKIVDQFWQKQLFTITGLITFLTWSKYLLCFENGVFKSVPLLAGTKLERGNELEYWILWNLYRSYITSWIPLLGNIDSITLFLTLTKFARLPRFDCFSKLNLCGDCSLSAQLIIDYQKCQTDQQTDFTRTMLPPHGHTPIS